MRVEIKQISKEYKEKQVLNNVSFDIESGTVCGLLGINGAGKSTLMKILIGMVSADSGRILDEWESRFESEIWGINRGSSNLPEFVCF